MTSAATYSNRNHSGPRPKLNRSAIASVALSVLPMIGLGSALGLFYGYRARRQIAAAQGRQAGRDLAEVGIALGWAGVLLAAVLIPFGVMVMFSLQASYGG